MLRKGKGRSTQKLQQAIPAAAVDVQVPQHVGVATHVASTVVPTGAMAVPNSMVDMAGGAGGAKVKKKRC
jgi:hypothetical protein